MDNQTEKLPKYSRKGIQNLKRFSLGFCGGDTHKSKSKLLLAISKSGITREYNEKPNEVLENLIKISKEKSGILYDSRIPGIFIEEDYKVESKLYICRSSRGPEMYFIRDEDEETPIALFPDDNEGPVFIE